MSWLNHLFLVYILFYFPWPYLCNIFLIIWNDIVMYPLPTPSSVWGAAWDLQTFLVLWIHVSGGPLLYWKTAACGFLFCFIQSFLLELRQAVASEGGLLWLMWNLWRQAIVPGQCGHQEVTWIWEQRPVGAIPWNMDCEHLPRQPRLSCQEIDHWLHPKSPTLLNPPSLHQHAH